MSAARLLQPITEWGFRQGRKIHQSYNRIPNISSGGIDPTKVAEAYIDGYNQLDGAKIIDLFGPTVNWEGQEVPSDEVDHATWWEAFPDLHLELHQIIADKTEAAFRFTFTGTHEGEFQGIEPTGEPVEVTEIIMILVGSDGINSLWFEWDELGFFSNLGEIAHPLA